MRLALLLSLFIVAFAPARAGQADPAVSAWSHGSHSSVRLIAGGRTSEGVYRIGVEVQLRSGFKTYWRNPGDSGVPPVFDWSGSENVGSLSVRWPAPQRFVTLGVTTIGYRDRVIFPAQIRPADPGKPTVATLKLDYGVCDTICIPAKAEVTLRLPEAGETSQTASLDRFRARVPRAKQPGKLDDKPGLISAAVERGGKSIELLVAIPPGGKVGDVFMEGPEGWFFGTPQVVSGEPDRTLVRMPVDERPKNVVGLVPVVLTIGGEPFASEIRFDLDMANANAK